MPKTRECPFLSSECEGKEWRALEERMEDMRSQGGLCLGLTSIRSAAILFIVTVLAGYCPERSRSLCRVCAGSNEIPSGQVKTEKFSCLISWPRFLKHVKRTVNKPELFLSPSLSRWLVHSLAAKGQFTHSQLHLYQSQPPPSPIHPPFHLRFLLVFAKQPCERNKIILKSIIWWEFWQWVEDGNYSLPLDSVALDR